MAWIPGGTFRMGAADFYPEERPVHTVTVQGFWIDEHPVTVAEFGRFIGDTGHTTMAERAPSADDFPDADTELLVPGSLVFHQPAGPVPMNDVRNWWSWTPGADWRHPEGPDSTVAGRERHPVTHVAYDDALAYAAWAGKELPTEAEWEYAARGGLDGAVYPWGDELAPGGQMMANTWQGGFPWHNSARDGFVGTSPVRSFAPNGYGLFDVVGNVWEWTCDEFRPRHEAAGTPCCGRSVREVDAAVARRVIKGGSHLCSADYCLRYRPAARQPESPDTSTSHIGLRCIVRSEQSAVPVAEEFK